MRSILTIAVAGALFVMFAPGASAKSMSVQVESAQLRERPSPFGKIVDTVTYGTRLKVVEEKEPWMLVETDSSITGWIHESSLTKKKLEVLGDGAADVSRAASSEELAMAGKGFNSQVESDFKAKNQDIDFSEIDKMEQIEIKDETIIEFLEEGGLTE